MSIYVHYGMILVRLCILAVSVLGYLLTLQKKVRIEFAIGVLFAGIGSLMFAAGILHILREAAWLVFAGGIWLLFREFRTASDRKTWLVEMPAKLFAPGVLMFLALAVFFMALLFRSEFTHYDNFSHWGVAAQVISRKDMFPNPADTNVTFTSYPLGSAAFLYFITEIVGTAPEWLQMWGQAVLMAGMLTSIFAFGRGIVCFATAGAGVVMLLCGNTPFVDLLVDTLLPVVAVSGMALCIYYKEELPEKIWFVIPYAVFLVSIKNSGMLFAAFLMLYVLLAIPRTKENLKSLLALLLSPVAVIFFWNRHVEQLFDDGTVSKHAMRVDNFQQILADKTPEDLIGILNAFWKYSSSSVKVIDYLLLLGMLLVVFRKLVLKKSSRELCNLVIFAGLSYVLYQLGLLGMYILSMPVEEALSMAGYGRYHQTIVLFFAGLMLIAALRELSACRTNWLGKICGVVLAVAVLSLTMDAVRPHTRYYSRQSLEGTERAKFDRLISDYGLWPEDRYLVLVDEERDDSGYLHHLTTYLLDPETFVLVTVSSVKELEENVYNFVIMFDDTEVNREYLQKQFGLDEEVGYIAGKPLY